MLQSDLSPKPHSLLIVTDLDGTLLDHHDYDYSAVLPVIARLKKARIPLVANTSKTRHEWLAMRSSFLNMDAFVIENGSVAYFPDGSNKVYGSAQRDILKVLAELRLEYQFRGFGELGVPGIIEQTGLKTNEAEQAAAREFSEPLLWEDSADNEALFCAEIAKRGFQTLKGGRFLHVQGKTDKGSALPALRAFYKADTIIALGDSPNDLAMIEQADIGVLISSPTNLGLDAPNSKRLIRTNQQGPKGWAETMTQLLDEHSL
ncbi:HAD-IIB family hydrolase [Akkermansiaceae bacterium]|nr:HAD-IIB family hydrolase [Akkermansiaceae bacterium]